MRLIDPIALKQSLAVSAILEDRQHIFDIIDAQPTIEERKTDKWIELDNDEERYDEIKCPHCRHTFTVDTYHWTDIGFTKSDLKFCPNCGADMRGEQDE